MILNKDTTYETHWQQSGRAEDRRWCEPGLPSLVQAEPALPCRMSKLAKKLLHCDNLHLKPVSKTTLAVRASASTFYNNTKLHYLQYMPDNQINGAEMGAGAGAEASVSANESADGQSSADSTC